MPLAEELVNRGHEVSVVMPYPTKKPNPKINEVIVDGTSWDELQQRMSNEKLQTGASQVPPLFEIIEEAILVRKCKFMRSYLGVIPIASREIIASLNKRLIAAK